MKAVDEVGWRRMWRFGITTLAMVPYRMALVPPLRTLFLRLMGSRVGRRVVIHDLRFFNAYRRGFSGLDIGDDCFVGDECLFDLAESITLGPQVTLAERVLILTHLNVGYRDHPLQASFPAMSAGVVIGRGSFVGANVTILAGTTLGENCFVAAGAVVTRSVPPRTLVGGVPARPLRALD